MQHVTKKRNIPMCVAGILAFLFVVSTSLMSGLYARFVSRDAGTDGTRVTAFSITKEFLEGGAAATAVTLDISPVSGANNTYQVRVKNNSEVSVRCRVSVENITGNLPILFTVNGEDNEHSRDFTANKDTFETYNISIQWDPNDPSFIYQGMVDQIRVVIDCEQID